MYIALICVVGVYMLDCIWYCEDNLDNDHSWDLTEILIKGVLYNLTKKTLSTMFVRN